MCSCEGKVAERGLRELDLFACLQNKVCFTALPTTSLMYSCFYGFETSFSAANLWPTT